MNYEYRSRNVTETSSSWSGDKSVEKTCNEWAQEGWEVFSVIVPQPSNHSTFRLTARRQITLTRPTGRKFR
jgi:hypothetical protein